MLINEAIKKEWYDALSKDSLFLSNQYVREFKEKHKDVYCFLHSFYRLRVELRKDIEAMSFVGAIQWFTLTFDNKHDKSLIASKRKNATRFLNDLFLCYTIVEEYGEDNNRYHIHGFGVYRDNKSFNDFRSWHSRQKVETIDNRKAHKKIKYLTDYMVKDIPRVRRSKNMVFLRNRYIKAKHMKRNFETCFACRVNLSVLRLRLGAI